MSTYHCAVVGGGIIGTAVAREIANQLPDAHVTIFEKEAALAAHQTGHNSGVVHAGLYYEPGSLKARLCRRGNDLLREFCTEHLIGYEECGKIVVARDEIETARLRDIYERSLLNGVPDVRMIGKEGIKEIEPAAVGKAALHSPHTAIVNYVEVTKALAADVEEAGGQVLCGQEVTQLERTSTGVKVRTTESADDFDIVICCAGLQADRLSRSAGADKDPRIVPFYGDFFMLRPEKRHLVNGLIYPVPAKNSPFLGVHLTKRIDGEIMLGPNAFLSLGREAYKGSQLSWRDFKDLIEVAIFPGFWKFAASNVPVAFGELRTALSKNRFVSEAAQYVPGIGPADVTLGGRGIRAQAMGTNGNLMDDFVIAEMGRLTHVRNAPSPGATSSLAIAEYVVERALRSADIRPGTCGT